MRRGIRQKEGRPNGRPGTTTLCITDRRDEPLRARRMASAGLVDLCPGRRGSCRRPPPQSSSRGGIACPNCRDVMLARVYLDFAVEPCHRSAPRLRVRPHDSLRGARPSGRGAVASFALGFPAALAAMVARTCFSIAVASTPSCAITLAKRARLPASRSDRPRCREAGMEARDQVCRSALLA